MNERRHGDPLVPLWRHRIGRITRLGVFPPVAVPLAMLVLAGFMSARPFAANPSEPKSGTENTEGAPAESPADPARSGEADAVSTTSEPAPAVSADDLQAALASAGFPNLSVAIDTVTQTVTISGSVVDEAAHRAALEAVARTAGVAGLTDIIDLIAIGEQAKAARVDIVVSRTNASLSGVVRDSASLEPIVDRLAETYRPDQIDAATVAFEPAALELATIQVSGQVSDPELAARLRTLLGALPGIIAEVDIEIVEPARVETILDDFLRASPLLFESGSAQLTATDRESLAEVASALAEFPAVVLEVGGHTDSQGDAAANLALSLRRAEAVVAALREFGVTNELSPGGYGELRPRREPETTAEDRALNRRIEFRLIPAG